jgi:predicted ATPase
MSRLGKQCLLETHSDTLIKQLYYHMVRNGEPAREAIAIYFVTQEDGGAA